MRFCKKSLVLVALVLSLIAATASIAAAEGFNDPQQYTATSTPSGPHGGYVSTSNKCKECHAVHLATGSYMLTRANTRAETCNFCHGVAGAGIGTKVALNEEGHGLSATQKNEENLIAPDDTVDPYTIQTSNWGCVECHSPHDNKTVKLAGNTTTKLLKQDPNQGKTYLYYNTSLINTSTKETTQTLSHWCSTCHNADFGLHTDPKQVLMSGTTQTAYGHAVSGSGYTTDTAGWAIVDPLDGINNGPTCRQCHTATGIGGKFPHSSESTSTGGSAVSTPDMLKSGSKATELDGICNGCHNTSSLQ